ncbi:MAG TPA: hypothetical protein VJM53_11480 [Burkholderiales bacterium]|nr:hypothetical protein [Burkholderiales bacterium]
MGNAYIDAQSLPESPELNDPLWWPIQKFFDLERKDPESIWAAMLLITEKTSDEKVIAVLAAGPLEGFIEYHGIEWIERIEREAKINTKFRNLLCGVWQSSTPEVWERVEKAREPIA